MNQTVPSPDFKELALKTIVVHTVTYFLMGILAVFFLDYAERFARPEMACWMRSTSDRIVTAGVLFQPIRGLLFAAVLFPIRSVIFQPRGWITIAGLLVGLGILSTFGPAPGSVEGFVYTVIPIPDQLVGWLEVIPQAVLLAVVVHAWIRHRNRRWIGVLLWTLFGLLIVVSTLGLVAGPTAG